MLEERFRDRERQRLSWKQICACCRDRVVFLDLLPIVLRVAIAVFSCLSTSTRLAQLIQVSLYFVATFDGRPSSPTPYHHRHPRRCPNMPLPENTTISLQNQSRPEDVLHSRPKQAIFLRLSAEALEALQASPTPQVQFTFGKRSVSSNSRCAIASARFSAS